jgi:hypothetical protein
MPVAHRRTHPPVKRETKPSLTTNNTTREVSEDSEDSEDSYAQARTRSPRHAAT